jgi:trypsin
MLPPSDGVGYVMNLPLCFKSNVNKVKIYAALVVALLTGSGNSPLADRIGVTSSTSRARKGSKDSASSSWSNIDPDWNSVHEKQISGSWLTEVRTMKQRLPKTDRIVGGTPAIVDTNNNGFMVALYYNANRFICGGSLITPTVVLTAAHCAPYVAFGRIHVNNKYGSQEEEGYEQFDVTHVITHPQYNSTLKRMDYALLKLNGWSQFGSTISLNNVSDIPAEQDRVTVLGWGTTSEGGLESKTLLSVTLNYVPFTECWEAYKHKNVITPSVICAGVEEGGKVCLFWTA